ncbi:unnamed protein product [Oppiella nova]|uniref:Elongation of very long chain fatty acids protein n=1 Tax=Oppiella nova TaxID=334625 RepID=A0A7R9M8D8_9ACAR|nr:unnamed protein product [Oppiella nova]CAG2172673.1 unnamed protein product [Oppiella nova]
MSLDTIVYLLHQYWVDTTDEHIKDYEFFGAGPALLILIMLSWLIFVTKLGPFVMNNRNPLVMREIIIGYNFVLVVINIYFIYASLKRLEFGRKSWNPRLPPSNQWSQKDIALLPLKCFYFYTKLFDLLDTIYFVLRKKSNQISFLHVYYHFMVPVMGWLAVKQCSQSVIVEVFCLLNSIVHTVMYLYYLLSAFGPQIQPYLWWKRYITRLQILQFIILLVYASWCITCGDMSRYPHGVKWLVTIQPIVFIYMFTNFYKNSYESKIKTN